MTSSASRLPPNRRSPILRHPFRLALLSVATAVLAACQTPVALDDNAEAGGSTRVERSGPMVRSPASERVIGGIAEMVLVDRVWPTFEAARENRIESIRDGTPLFAFIRATRPLGEIAHPADPGGNFSFSDFAHLQIQVGDTDSLRIISTCYVTMTTEEARRREIIVPLAPLTYRPGQVPSDCWLEAASGGRSGPRTYEVRLAGFPGKFERWLPVPDLMSVAQVGTDFENGAGEYATMLRATPLRSATVVASTMVVGSSLVALDDSPVATPIPASSVTAAGQAAGNAPSTLVPVGDSPEPFTPSMQPAPVRTASVAPSLSGATLAPATAGFAAASAPLPGPRQEIGGSRMELQLRSLSAATLGRQPSDTWFVDRQWTGVTDSRGRTHTQQAHAAAIFRGETCSWQRLLATRRPNATALADVVVAGEPVVVNCADLP